MEWQVRYERVYKVVSLGEQYGAVRVGITAVSPTNAAALPDEMSLLLSKEETDGLKLGHQFALTLRRLPELA
jgi:hypothetical protein